MARRIRLLCTLLGRLLTRLLSDLLVVAGIFGLAVAGWLVRPALGIAIASVACIAVGAVMELGKPKVDGE